MTATQRTSLPGLVRGLGIVVGLSLVFGTVAAFMAPGAAPGGWDEQTVAQRILEKNPGGCQVPAAPALEPPREDEAGLPVSPRPRGVRERTPLPPTIAPLFDGPLRAQIINEGGACRTLFGAEFGQGMPGYRVPIDDSGAILEVDLDKPLEARPSWKFPAFLITFVGALFTGLVALTLGSGTAVANVRRGGFQPPHAPSTFAGRPMPAAQQAPPRPTASSSGPKKASRPVSLSALTTSGLSGLTVDRGTSGHFDVYAATQVGLQHAAHGQTREDAYAVGNAGESGWVFIAVADGLGSARNSHAAAQIAAKSAIAQMHQRLSALNPTHAAPRWRGIAAEIVSSVEAALTPQSADNLAAHLNFVPARPYGDLKRAAPACTLAFAALGPVHEDGYSLLWGCVGDSDILLVDLQSQRVDWLTDTPTKQGGGLVSNVTHALPRDADQVRAGIVQASTSVMTVLASDGMADAIRQETEQFAQLLPQVAQRRPSEWQFGEIVGFDLPGLHDDRTLIAAWPRHADAAQRS